MPPRVTLPIVKPSSLSTPRTEDGDVMRRMNIATRLPMPTITTPAGMPPTISTRIFSRMNRRRSRAVVSVLAVSDVATESGFIISTDERRPTMGDTDLLTRVTHDVASLVCTNVQHAANFVPSFSALTPASDATTILRWTAEVR